MLCAIFLVFVGDPHSPQALAQHGVGPIFSQTKFTYLWEVDSKPIQVVRVDEVRLPLLTVLTPVDPALA